MKFLSIFLTVCVGIVLGMQATSSSGSTPAPSTSSTTENHPGTTIATSQPATTALSSPSTTITSSSHPMTTLSSTLPVTTATSTSQSTTTMSSISPTTTTSTSQPKTTMTTARPVTTNAPTGTAVHTNNYKFKDDNGTICLLATFGAQFVEEKNDTNYWNVPKNARVDSARSECGVLVVNFDHSSFTIRFRKGGKNDKDFYIHEVDAVLESLNVSAHNLSEAETPMGSSYKCDSGLKIELRGTNANVTFKMTKVRLQPFEVPKGKFDTAKNCESDLSPIVPIIVGAVLAGLVVVVVIAYFIGRNRNRAGYEEI